MAVEQERRERKVMLEEARQQAIEKERQACAAIAEAFGRNPYANCWQREAGQEIAKRIKAQNGTP